MNVYQSPEDHGLKIFADVEDDDLSYAFDMFVVWERIEDGKLFFESDNGCSCPLPFGDCTDVSSLEKLDNYERFIAELEEWNEKFNGGSKVSVDEIMSLEKKVREKMR